MNKVVLIGRLARDPEVRYSQNDTSMAIARFSLAVDRRGRSNNPDGQTADFISCVALGRTAEFIERYFTKGNRIGVYGHIQTGSYTNKDGQKVYTTDVVAEDQEFAESKGASGEGGVAGGNGFQSNSGNEPAGDGFMTIPDGIIDDLPFN